MWGDEMEKLNLNALAQDVFNNFVELDGTTITNFDLLGYEKLVGLLTDNLRRFKKDSKNKEKEEKAKKSEANAEIGKAYYNSLKVGDSIKVVIGGETFDAIKIETKSKSNSSVACEVEGKGNRYLKFDKIVVPADFSQVA